MSAPLKPDESHEPPRPPDRPSNRPETKPPTLVDTILSVLASFFGVQSDKNRERDFTSGNAGVFIGVAIVLTVLFVFALILIVKIMLRNAGM